MSFKEWLVENKLTFIKQDNWSKWFRMDIQDDEFVHFTTLERAEQVIKTGRLLFKPPHPKFGTDTVDAISIVYGQYVPETQTNHIKGDVVAIRFKTSAIPDSGHAEEVKWMSDVKLLNPSIISKEEAIHLLEKTPERIPEDGLVLYLDFDDLQKNIGVPSTDWDRYYDAKQAYYQQLNSE